MNPSPLLQSMMAPYQPEANPAKVLGEALRDLLAEAPKHGPASEVFQRIHRASSAMARHPDNVVNLTELGQLAHQALCEWCLGRKVDAAQLARDREAGKALQA